MQTGAVIAVLKEARRQGLLPQLQSEGSEAHLAASVQVLNSELESRDFDAVRQQAANVSDPVRRCCLSTRICISSGAALYAEQSRSMLQARTSTHQAVLP